MNCRQAWGAQEITAHVEACRRTPAAEPVPDVLAPGDYVSDGQTWIRIIRVSRFVLVGIDRRGRQHSKNAAQIEELRRRHELNSNKRKELANVLR